MSKKSVVIQGKCFVSFLEAAEIQARIAELAIVLRERYAGRLPVVMPILNGSFMVAAELLKVLDIACEVSFVKLKSYEGMQSTGQVSMPLGLDVSLAGREVLIVEDIIDTGKTISSFRTWLAGEQPASVEVFTLLFKPAAVRYPIVPDYVGFEIPLDFVVGFGLDYDGLGRNLPDLYRLAPES